MALDPKKKAALIAEKSKKMAPPKKGKDGKKEMSAHDEDDEHGGDDEETGPHPKGGDEGEHDEDKEIAEQQAGRVADGEGDGDLMSLAADVDPDHNPPDWVEDEDTWERAKDAVDKLEDEPDDYYAVVVHVYEQMGGGIAGRSDGGSGE